MGSTKRYLRRSARQTRREPKGERVPGSGTTVRDSLSGVCTPLPAPVSTQATRTVPVGREPADSPLIPAAPPPGLSYAPRLNSYAVNELAVTPACALALASELSV